MSDNLLMAQKLKEQQKCWEKLSFYGEQFAVSLRLWQPRSTPSESTRPINTPHIIYINIDSRDIWQRLMLTTEEKFLFPKSLWIFTGPTSKCLFLEVVLAFNWDRTKPPGVRLRSIIDNQSLSRQHRKAFGVKNKHMSSKQSALLIMLRSGFLRED